jgi:hypothetical protein
LKEKDQSDVYQTMAIQMELENVCTKLKMEREARESEKVKTKTWINY